MTEPQWMAVARKELGVREVPGGGANPRIVEYFRASGHTRIVDDETAWCSAFINWVFREVNIKGTMALNARSWMQWGKVTQPRPGAVCVFRRGTGGWQGHVGFYVGESETYIRVLGGNQSDGVNIGSYPKSRLIAVRWPPTMTGSRTFVSALVGSGATGATGIIEVLEEARGYAETAVAYLDWAKYILMGIIFVSFALTMYFKFTDIKRMRFTEKDGVDV